MFKLFSSTLCRDGFHVFVHSGSIFARAGSHGFLVKALRASALNKLAGLALIALLEMGNAIKAVSPTACHLIQKGTKIRNESFAINSPLSST